MSNPYAPPAAEVRDIGQAQPVDVSPGDFIPQGRARPAGQGWQWFQQAWRVFKIHPWMWIGAALLFILVLGTLSAVPIIKLFVGVMGTFFYAGMGENARATLGGEDFRWNRFLAGFRKRPLSLFYATLAYSVVMVALYYLLGLIFGADHFFSSILLGLGGKQERTKVMGHLGGGFWAAYFALMLPLGMLMAYTPYLIHENGLSPGDALRTSFMACAKNIPAMLVWVLSSMLWGILAVLALGVGLFAYLPVLVLTQYMAYRDIFYDESRSPSGR